MLPEIDDTRIKDHAVYDMNKDSLEELTIATDMAMARALENRFTILSAETPPEEVGGKLLRAQLALDRLGSGPPPDYDDEWLAPLYLGWYGPSHINMAYTLFTQVVPRYDDSVSDGPAGVHLEDYACGTFAGQFAFALAASEATKPFSSDRVLSIYSHDSSDPMWSLGKETWDSVLQVLGSPWDVENPYPNLDSLRDTARLLQFRRKNNYRAPVWLTVFHGAYPGEAGQELRDKVNQLVQRNQPKLILVTAHPKREQDIYIAPVDSYEVLASSIGPPLALVGVFKQVTAWRRRLADECIDPLTAAKEGFEDWEYQRGLKLLAEYSTTWSPRYFEYVYSLYVRKDG